MRRNVLLMAMLAVWTCSPTATVKSQETDPPPQFEPPIVIEAPQLPETEQRVPRPDNLVEPVFRVPAPPREGESTPYRPGSTGNNLNTRWSTLPRPFLPPVELAYKDPRGRFVLHYETKEPKLSQDQIVRRIETALEIHQRESQMGAHPFDEPIQIYIGEYKLESDREVPNANIAAATSREHSHLVIKAPPGQATLEIFLHELVHTHMIADGYVNVPYWLAEGIAHLFETKAEYNHSMWRWLQFERPLTEERLGAAHASSQDSMRRRATGWALCFYYHHYLGESWQQMCRRRTHVDPQVAWEWVQDHFNRIDLETQVSRLERSGRQVPESLRLRLAQLKSKADQAEAIRLGQRPGDESSSAFAR